MKRVHEKRIWTRLLVISIMILAAVTVPATSRVEAVKIEWLYLAGADATELRNQALAEAFERENPEITVERIRVISNYADRLATLLATGTAPDVISLDMTYISAFGDERFLHDLWPLIERTPEYQIEYVAQPMLDVFTIDGKLFAAPATANPTAYVFNADLFERSGLVSPYDLYMDDEWTWDAFRQAARKLTRKYPDGRFESLGARLHLPRTWMFSNGGREVDDPHRPTTSYFSLDENVEALKFVRSLIIEDDVMRPSGRTMTEAIGGDHISGFVQGKLGMSTHWLSYLPALGEGGGINMGLVPYPKGPAPGGRYATDLGMFGVAITRTTPNLEAAWRFVSFITGPEGAALASALAGMTPSRPANLDWMGQLVFNPEVYADLLIHGTIRVISRNQTDIQRIIDDELAQVWAGTVPVENAVVEIDRRIQAYLEQNPQ